MKHRIIFGTGNAGKMREIRLILGDLGCEILSMKEAGADPEIVEDGNTFGENAEIKARAVWECTGDIVLADDSGLVVDYIGGEPGIYSARYMGEETSYEVKNRNIIHRLREAKGSAVHVLCAISLQCCRTDMWCTRRQPWRGRLPMSRRGKEGLAMIRS